MPDTPAPRVLPLKPLPTGIPGLDTVLGGGLPSGDLLFVVGVPGSGKTVLALQLAFARIKRGGKALLLTSFSEGHDKLIGHVLGFSFCDQTVIGQALQLLSLLPMLENGPEETTRAVVRTARQQATDLVIIDGFRGIHDAFGSDLASRQFLQLLSTQLAYLGATLVITAEFDASERGHFSDLTTADSIIALSQQRVGLQQRRLLEVRKLRGGAPLAGAHAYRINSSGLTVFPRLESIALPALPPVAMGRASFGLPALDGMLGGGLTTSTTTLLAGSPGTGKTVLGLHFLVAGLQAGEQGLFVTVHETEDQLRDKARAFGLEIDEALTMDRLRFLRRAPVELDVDELATAVQEELARRPVRRVVIDGLSTLERTLAVDGRAADFLASLVELLRARQVTSIFTLEIGQYGGEELNLASSPFFFLGENLLLLRQIPYQNQFRRLLSVLKMRFSGYDPTIREFTIGDGGIAVGGPLGDERSITPGGNAPGEAAAHVDEGRAPGAK
ncbi:MAG TPA: ATPase domain-containing protein [Herpetosiphonaceae bacterium]|nr:ATPase domain-containing protein [Herpetosiphonaceae bacterium]